MSIRQKHAELKEVLEYLHQEQDLMAKESAELKGLCIKAGLDNETHDTMHNLLFHGRKQTFKLIMSKFDESLAQLKKQMRDMK